MKVYVMGEHVKDEQWGFKLFYKTHSENHTYV